MFNLFKKIKTGDIENPITAMCKCGHRWSWHYIDSNNNKCYAHKIEGRIWECMCEGYSENTV